jgi:hypothetical protein
MLYCTVPTTQREVRIRYPVSSGGWGRHDKVPGSIKSMRIRNPRLKFQILPDLDQQLRYHIHLSTSFLSSVYLNFFIGYIRSILGNSRSINKNEAQLLASALWFNYGKMFGNMLRKFFLNLITCFLVWFENLKSSRFFSPCI